MSESPATAELPIYVTTPVYRQLRGYAIDPSLSQDLATATVNQVLFRLPWEALQPGPIGEYLEVIDYDPASKCYYEPVDLDQPYLLAQDGLVPSEGTPQFHQQMVYAVASLTIRNFERALGRKALWSPGPAGEYVRRLRLYPHGLREPNAYYSPAKKALLFGYFPAAPRSAAQHVPGGMVFTCLSHDIIAHETTHALLDGLQRRFNRPTNPDMLAFHEAFADLVALFQHFTFPNVLRHQIARSRGDLREQETLLGQLAGQFGRATGSRAALREAIGAFDEKTDRWVPQKPDPAAYQASTAPHTRGSFLVAAVFDAFLSIYGARIADLLRLSTEGTGVLRPGAIHPDLVERLSDEASTAATHVLSMCVRALDYCPPLDLTFGEYLRALLTADADLVPDDDRNYRVAFVEAFRRRGLFPHDVRTLSADSLYWRRPGREGWHPSTALQETLFQLRGFGNKQLYTGDREKLFHHTLAECQKLQAWLLQHLNSGEAGAQDAAFLGLQVPSQSIRVDSLRFASRTGPDGDLLLQAIVQIMQSTRDQPASPEFEGGCTLVINLRNAEIAYCIRKPITSKTRRDRERHFLAQASRPSLRTTYFQPAADDAELREPFALLHRGL